jgi:hypothetical protein
VRILGSADLTTIELPDQLQFVSGYQSGWVDFMAPPAALFIVFLWAMISHYYLLAWFVVIGYLLLVLWWLSTSVTRLFVTPTQLVARGNLGRTYHAERRVDTEELKTLSYFSGGNDQPPGLYAYHGWSSTCLIPKVTEVEANIIINAIHAKFPNLERGQFAEMEAIHAEANGEFHPHVQILEVDPLDDLRHWTAVKSKEFEEQDPSHWLKKSPQDLESK